METTNEDYARKMARVTSTRHLNLNALLKEHFCPEEEPSPEEKPKPKRKRRKEENGTPVD